MCKMAFLMSSFCSLLSHFMSLKTLEFRRIYPCSTGKYAVDICIHFPMVPRLISSHTNKFNISMTMNGPGPFGQTFLDTSADSANRKKKTNKRKNVQWYSHNLISPDSITILYIIIHRHARTHSSSASITRFMFKHNENDITINNEAVMVRWKIDLPSLFCLLNFIIIKLYEYY